MMTLEEAEKRIEEARAYLHIDEKIAELANLDSRIANLIFGTIPITLSGSASRRPTYVM